MARSGSEGVPVLADVIIGCGTLVGAGSRVTRRTPASSVWRAVPVAEQGCVRTSQENRLVLGSDL